MRQRIASLWILNGMIAVGLISVAAPQSLALDGANPLELTPMNGWDAFELVTQNDNITPISDAGYGNSLTRGKFDGLGAYVSGKNFSVHINHESSSAAISRIDLDLLSFREAIDNKVDGSSPFPTSIATGVGYAYDTIYDGSYHAMSNSAPVASGTVAVGVYGDANFNRFCSGTSHAADAFGAGRGFADSIYMTGEEESGGLFYALDEATNTLWQAPDLGLGSWENAAQVDTGNTSHVALVLNSDVGSSPGDYLQLYVGEKNIDTNGDGEVDFLEKNGLRGGTIYYYKPDIGQSTTDLPDGLATGLWSTSTSGALQETKLEDNHTNPLDGNQLVFADQTDGIYVMDLTLQFSGGILDTVNSPVSINQIDDDDSGVIGAPDNITWSGNNKIYVQEDGSGDDMYEMNPDGTGILQIAHGFSEPSGILDVSKLVGYQPGSVLLSSLQGSGGSGGQLSVLLSPTATLCLGGDADCDGDVDLDDVITVVGNFTGPNPTLPTPPFTKTRAEGDFTTGLVGDGDVDLDDVILMVGAFTGPLDGETVVAASAGDTGLPDLIYDASTGEVFLDAAEIGGTLQAYNIKNAGSGILNGNFTAILGGPPATDLPTEIGEFQLSPTATAPGGTSIGLVFPAGMDLAALAAFVTGGSASPSFGGGSFSWELFLINPPVPSVPEPATISLLVVGLFGLMLLRRQRCI